MQQRITFVTEDALDHCCRALDIARRAGCALKSVIVAPVDAHWFGITIDIDAASAEIASTVQARIDGLVGIGAWSAGQVLVAPAVAV